jgi:hypothetical protein
LRAAVKSAIAFCRSALTPEAMLSKSSAAEQKGAMDRAKDKARQAGLEIRNPKSEIRKKSEVRHPSAWASDRQHVLCVSPGRRIVSGFAFRISFGFRISDFGFKAECFME